MCCCLISITCLYTVVKAERVSNDSVGKDYVFPDEDDNLTAYTGGSAQLTVPSGLLQHISKHIISYCTWENFAWKKLANLVNHELFAKVFLANIHRYAKNVFGICTD